MSCISWDWEKTEMYLTNADVDFDQKTYFDRNYENRAIWDGSNIILTPPEPREPTDCKSWNSNVKLFGDFAPKPWLINFKAGHDPHGVCRWSWIFYSGSQYSRTKSVQILRAIRATSFTMTRFWCRNSPNSRSFGKLFIWHPTPFEHIGTARMLILKARASP